MRNKKKNETKREKGKRKLVLIDLMSFKSTSLNSQSTQNNPNLSTLFPSNDVLEPKL